MNNFLSKFFKLEEYNTTVKTEVMGGITTFLTMAYILGVNVGILSIAGIPAEAVFLATAISAAIATIFMGLYANAPIALAPGMGLNAFFTYTIVLTYGYSWQEGLAMVFLSGVAFLLISVLGLRKAIIDLIPSNLKQSIGAAIGFFIAFIGLVKMGVIVSSPATYVTLGNLKNPTVLLALFGLFLTIILLSRGMKSAVFIGLVLTAVLGITLNKFGIKGMPEVPSRIVSFSFDSSAVGAFIHGLKKVIVDPHTIVIVFTLLFVDFFDTAGTLIAVSGRIGDKYDMNKMLYSDALGTIAGSVLGTSNVTSYVESTSGIAAGARTGLASIVTGILFLLSTLFSPLLSVVQGINVDQLTLEPVVAPALFIVGILMAIQLSNVDWHDFSATVSGFTTIIIMVLSYSIADGIASGFIMYVVSKVFTNKIKEIKPGIWVLFVVFILHFIL